MATVIINGETFEFPNKNIKLGKIIHRFISDNITIEDINGDLIIDSSEFAGCNITIEDINGDLNIIGANINGSNFTIEDVAGDVNVFRDEKPSNFKEEKLSQCNNDGSSVKINGKWVNVPTSR